MSRITSRTATQADVGVQAAEHLSKIGQVPQPFARNARDAHAAGLIVIPTAPDDAKRPLVRWGRLERQPRLSTLEKWACKFPGANLAYLPVPSGLVVVDVDDVAAEDRVRRLLGLEDTPIVIASGRRGLHFPLRSEQSVPNLNLRPFGLVADIKGASSIVVGPGSIHPETRQPYRFIRGDWDAFADAPLLDVAALEEIIGRRIDRPQEVPRSQTPTRNLEGRRNASTFVHLLGLGAAGLVSTETEVIEAARDYNADHNDPPEPDSKVAATARSVWNYVQGGTCRAPRQHAYVSLTRQEDAALRTLGRDYADALALFLELKRAHSARAQRGEAFAIAADAMAREHVIPGWTDRKRYMRAKRALLKCGLIARVRRQVRQSWRGNDGNLRWGGLTPAQYRFAPGRKICGSRRRRRRCRSGPACSSARFSVAGSSHSRAGALL